VTQRVDLGMLLRYDGKLVECVAFNENQGRNLILRPVNASPCPTCGSLGDIHVLEQSLLFEQKAQPVKTIDRKERS